MHLSHLKVTLIGVEDDRLLLVVLSHHFHCDSIDRRLKIALLGVYHHSDVGLLCVPGDRVYASHHVLVYLVKRGESVYKLNYDFSILKSNLKHFLLFASQTGDHFFDFARTNVDHSENIADHLFHFN